MTLPKKNLINAEGYDIPLFLDNYKLKLDSNESEIGPSPKVLESIQNISQEEIKYYPAYGELLNELARVNNVCSSKILPTNGADESIKYVFDTFIDTEDTVLTVTPTFVMSKIYAKAACCTYKEVPYTEKFTFPVDELIKNIDEKTKLIIITTPNNPTGEAISEENLLKVIKAAKNQYVLIDETYHNYYGKTFAGLIEQHSNVIIVRSMSKDYGLAGLRLGYILTAQENIQHIKKIISPYSVNNIAAKAAVAALQDKDHLNYVISEVNSAKELLKKELLKFTSKIYKSDANFILADFGEKAQFIYKKLLNAGIKVKSFGNTKHLENCLRITIPSTNSTTLIINALKSRDSIIFDMDGVIVDTRNSYRLAIKGTFEHFSNKTIDFSDIQKAKNTGGLNNDWDLTEYLLKKEGFSIPKQEIIDKFQELYFPKNGKGFIQNENLLISREVLAKLSKDYDLAIYTGRPKKEAEFVLNRWNLEYYFLNLYAMEDVPEDKHKPHPYGIIKTLNLINPIKAYYLGDTPDDMIAATQAKVSPIGILPPQDKSSELKKLLIEKGAETVLDSAEEIQELLYKAGVNQ